MTLGRIPTHALSRLRHLDHLRSRPGVRSGHTFHTGHLHRRGWSPPPRDVLLQLTRYLHGSVGSGQSGQRFQPRHSGERAVLGHARRRRYRRRREGVGRQGALRSRGHGDRGLSRSRERAAGWAVRGGDCVFRGRVAPQDSNTGAHRRHGRSAVPGNIHADERAREMVGAQEGFRIPVGLGGAGRPLGRSRRGAQRRLLLLTAARRKVKSDRQSDCESDFGIVPEDCDQAAPRKSDAGRLPARRKIWDGTSLSSSLTDIHSGA
jgi:hypothetical protein